MDKEEIKNKIDFNNVKELVGLNAFNEVERYDYLIDSEGNHIVYLSPLDVRLIERIKELEARIIELEK